MSKQLTRTTDDKWVAGVCGGVARYLDVDANLVRLVTAVLTIVGVGTVAALYVVAWVLMPKAPGFNGPGATPPAPAPPSPPDR